MENKFTRTPSYLSRNSYGYCIRIRVPVDLVSIIHKKELRYSLRTGYLGVAKSRSRIFSASVLCLFDYVRRFSGSMKISDEQIRSMVDSFLKQMTDRMKETTTPSLSQIPLQFDSIKGYVQYLKELQESGKLDYAIGNYRVSESYANKLLEESGLTDVDKSDPQFAKLCLEVLRAEIKSRDLRIQQLRTVSGELNFGSDAPELPQPIINASQQEQRLTVSLSQVIEEYINENLKAGNWNERSIIDNRSIFKNILRLLGDVPVCEIDSSKVQFFKKVLLSLPSIFSKLQTFTKIRPLTLS